MTNKFPSESIMDPGLKPLGRCWTLWGLLLLLAIALQGARGLWDPDEGRYTDVALEMLESGDWLHPRLHSDQLHYTKPPLTYWTIAASLGFLGRHEWAARLPNALAFFFTALLVGALARELGMAHPRMASLLYATTLLPFAAANIITTDTLLTLWETFAMWCFVAGWRRNAGLWQAGFWLALGLAFLTKGPPGLMPLVALVPWLIREREWSLLTRLFHPTGLLVFAVVGLGWYLIVIRDTPGLLDYFLHKEVAGRILTSGHHRHGEWYGGFEIYLPTLLVGALPWWPVALWHAHRNRFRTAGDAASRRFLLFWLGAPLLVFMLARSRLPLYLLPLFVPLTLLMYLSLVPAFSSFRSIGTRIALLTGALLILARGGAALLASDADSRRLASRLSLWMTPAVQELVFVDTRPRYGVHFYLERPVEGVHWQTPPDRMAFQKQESLDTELRHDALPRLVLLPIDESTRLEALLDKSGFHWEKEGEAADLAVYLVTPSRGGFIPPA